MSRRLAGARAAGIRRAWDPCDRGSGLLVATLRRQGIEAIGTDDDFLARAEAPLHISDLITNPPYGENRRGELAVRFIEHALELGVPRIAMLLRNDFDSAITRQHLFRNEPRFAGKIVLLNRIKWFVGPSSPSDNHSFFLWDRGHRGAPSIHYVTRHEAEASMS
jgi:predicted RNA methylase